MKILGLFALALGLMAFIASAAQAEPTSHWNVAGKSVTGAEEIQLEIKEIENNTGALAFTTKSGTKVKILCTAMKFDEGGRLIKEGGISLGRILYTGCRVLLNGVVAPSCLPKTTGQAFDSILTLKFKGLITLDEVSSVKEDYVKFVPDEGTVFADIELGFECAIGELVKVEENTSVGGVWIKDCKGNTGFVTSAFIHLFEESLHGLSALGQPAVLEGSATALLNSGAPWSGTPG